MLASILSVIFVADFEFLTLKDVESTLIVAIKLLFCHI
jgi:hypothetical protein